MLLKYFYDYDLAQASYFVGCPASGEAIVIDPARDITPYLALAKQRNLTITHVAETHIHADFISGGKELAATTGATLYISDYGGELGYQFDDSVKTKRVREGDDLYVGRIKFTVLFTPGHTPEHIAYLMTDGGASQPFGLFSGDCLFVGDMGRPDLLEKAVGVVGSSTTGAHQQFENMQRFKTLPDYLQVFPGHGAGSACGKSLGDVPTTTLGYEKLFNPAFQFDDEAAFVEWMLSDQPAPPRYFAQMKKVNQRGAALISTLHNPRPIVYDTEVEHAVKQLLIDTRPMSAFAAAHIPDSVNIPAEYPKFSTWAGWFIDYDQPVYLVVDDHQLQQTVTRLRAIGVDQIAGYVRVETAMRYRATVRQVTPQTAQALQQDGALIVDVRDAGERKESAIPGSLFIPMGEIPYRLDELPKDKTIIVQCGSGTRSQIVASLLQKYRYPHVYNLQGGIAAWQAAAQPV